MKALLNSAKVPVTSGNGADGRMDQDGRRHEHLDTLKMSGTSSKQNDIDAEKVPPLSGSNGALACGIVIESLQMTQLARGTPSGDPSRPGAYAQEPGGARPLRLVPSRPSDLSSRQPSLLPPLVILAPSSSSSAGGLVEARPVPEEDQLHPTAVAEAHSHDGDNSSLSNRTRTGQRKEKNKKVAALLAGSLICIVVLAFVIVMVVVWRSGRLGDISNSNNGQDSTASGNSAEKEDAGSNATAYVDLSPEVYLKHFLLNQTSLSTDANSNILAANLDDPASAQSKAFEWLRNDPVLQSYSQDRLRQRFALATFYHATNGTWWTQSTRWMSYDYHECEWLMIPQVSLSAQVAPETSPCQSIGGEPWSAANDLVDEHNSAYKILGLRMNNLEGSLPNEFYWLTNLESIAMSYNAISGTLSTEISKLTNLKEFAVATNQMSGKLPTELGLMTNLTVFSVGIRGNLFTGTIPRELTRLTRLQTLELSNNLFTGDISSELGLLVDLQILGLCGLRLVNAGTVPTELGRLTSLLYSAFWRSQFTGSLPTEIGYLTNLKWFHFEDNGLAGLPSEIGRMTALQEIRLANNAFSTLPSEIARLQSLYDLNVGGNQLTGQIPLLVGELTGLRSLNLEDNLYSGFLPSEIGQLTDLEVFNVAKNALTGSLPNELGNLVSLQEMMLNDNGFVGTLPSELGRLETLLTWNSANNDLSGSVPPELELWPNITYFNVSGNSLLSGTIPDGLCAASVALLFDCDSSRLCGCNCSCTNE